MAISSSRGPFMATTRRRRRSLGARLQQIASSSRQQGGPRIYLRADRTLDYGRVMQVMGEINRAGLRRVALVSTAREERR